MKKFDINRVAGLIGQRDVERDRQILIDNANEGEQLRTLVTSREWPIFEAMLTQFRESAINAMPAERRSFLSLPKYLFGMLRVSHRLELIDDLRGEISIRIRRGDESMRQIDKLNKETE